jgi:hypothetical protein
MLRRQIKHKTPNTNITCLFNPVQILAKHYSAVKGPHCTLHVVTANGGIDSNMALSPVLRLQRQSAVVNE